jgi:fumarate reductase subunit D
LVHALHRLSGLDLCCFPLLRHSYIFVQSIDEIQRRFDHFLRFRRKIPLVKIFAESGLVFGLAVHMFGGLRMMAMEWLSRSDKQKKRWRGRGTCCLSLSPLDYFSCR